MKHFKRVYKLINAFWSSITASRWRSDITYRYLLIPPSSSFSIWKLKISPGLTYLESMVKFVAHNLPSRQKLLNKNGPFKLSRCHERNTYFFFFFCHTSVVTRYIHFNSRCNTCFWNAPATVGGYQHICTFLLFRFEHEWPDLSPSSIDYFPTWNLEIHPNSHKWLI